MAFSFKDIIAWQKSYDFVLLVYKATKKFPDFEKHGLSSQFQRAAVSIAANIAEGYRKLSQADKLRFLNIAQGSLEESRYYCILSRDLGYIDSSVYDSLISGVRETSFFLNAYIKGIKDNQFRSSME